MKNKLVIVMKGGLICAIHSNIEAEVVLLDWDDVEYGEMTTKQMEMEVEEETKNLKAIF